MRVLYVEDVPSDADLTLREMRSSAPDIHLDVVGSVAGALAILNDFQAAMARGESARFDLVLLDLSLPDGSGLNVLAEVRHRSLPLAVVVLTGSGDEQSVLAALRAGADDYVAKRQEYWAALAPTLRTAVARFRSQAARRLRPLRLLYAEPNEHDVSLTQIHLATQAPFIRLEVVHTAAEVLARLPQSGAAADVDVVLLDYHLPGMNALDALKEILEMRGLDVPVILTTGHGNEIVALEALKLGAADYIAKSPGYLHLLPAAVEAAFHRAEAARENAALVRREQDLRESEERFRQLADNIKEAFWLTDPGKSEMLYISPAYEEIWGRTRKSLYLSPRDWVDAIHPDDKARVVEAAQTQQVQGAYVEQYRILRPDGTTRWIQDRAFPVHDDSGRVIRIAGVAEDITERKQQEQFSAAEKQILELIARNSPIAEVLDSVCRVFEKQSLKGASCSILLLDDDGVHLRHVAAPSLPKRYVRAIDGAAIGPAAGSFGTAAYLGRQVIVTDIASDPRWRDYQEVALRDGLLACWSTPVFSDNGKVVATFAIYYRYVRAPTEAELRLIERAAFLASIRITREKSERALRDSEERFRAFQESSPMSARVVDAQGRITYANRVYLANVGLPAEQVIGKSLFEVFPEKYASEFAAANARVLQSGGVEHVEETLPFADGRLHTMSAYRFAFTDASGARSAGIVAIDSTARKQAEELLRASQERFEIVVRATNDAIWDWDLENDTIWWNENFFGIYGYKREDVERGAGSWTSRIHPDDRDRVVDGIHSVIEGGTQSWSDEYRFRLADGSFADILDRGFVVRDASGRGVRMIGAMQDVTQRKQTEIRIRESEAKYRGLIEQASDGIFITDAQGNYRLVNSRACELLGFAESEMIGMNGSMTHVAEERAAYANRLQAIAEGKVLRYERMMKRKDGSVFPAEVSAKKLGNDAVQVIFRDITERKLAEAKLRQSEARFRSFVEQSPDAMIIHQAGTIVFANDTMVRLLRAGDTGALVGRPATSLVVAGLADLAQQRIARLYSGQSVPLSEQVYVRPDGTTVEVEVASSPIVLDGWPAALVTAREITERREQQLKIARLSRIQEVLSGINSAIVRIRDRQELLEEACRIAVEHGGFSIGWIAVLDPASGKLFPVAQAGLPMDIGVGGDTSNRPAGLVPGGTAEVALREKQPAFDNDIEHQPGVANAEIAPDTLIIRRAAIGMGAKSVIVLPLFAEGQTFGILSLYAPERNFFDDEELKLLSELAGDISFGLEFIAKEEKVDYLAYYDALTGLPNRSLFFDRLTHQLGSAARDGLNVALVLMNLDRFRLVNDTLGRQAGDALIITVAQRIKATFRDQDTVARVGADSFAVAVTGTWQAPDAGRVLEAHNRQLFGQPFLVGKEVLRVSATAGVAVFPGDGDNPEVLFANAEAALRKAKQQNARFLFYGPEMNVRIADALRLENRLRLALENGEMVLWYQPKIDVKTGKLTGFEALMRWQDPETGMVPPARFIPLMEQTGLILEAGRWALAQVAKDCSLWSTNGVKPPRVAVNVSPLQLRQKDFVAIVAEAVRNTKEAGSMLDLEITESVIMDNVEAIIPILHTARGLGMEIAVDDFGTGYSSLAYIARLPIHALKIDRSFVIGMTQNQESLAIVRSVISLAHSLRLHVIAEGVETEEQAAALRQLECDQMQGYLLSRPVPPDAVPALVRKLT